MTTRAVALAFLCAAAALALAARAPADPRLGPGERVGFDPPLGAPLAADAPVLDEDGTRVPLGALLEGVSVVVPVYYRCPNLCDLTLDGVAELLERSRVDRALVLSFAADESPADAHAMREELARRHAAAAADARLRLLTAPRESIDRITRSIGFRFALDADSGLYSHVAGLVVVDARGTLVGFMPGVRFDAARFEAIASGREPAGASAPALLLWCFDYDPRTGRYTLAVLRVVQACSVLALAAIAAAIFVMSRRRGRAHGR